MYMSKCTSCKASKPSRSSVEKSPPSEYDFHIDSRYSTYTERLFDRFPYEYLMVLHKLKQFKLYRHIDIDTYFNYLESNWNTILYIMKRYESKNMEHLLNENLRLLLHHNKNFREKKVRDIYKWKDEMQTAMDYLKGQITIAKEKKEKEHETEKALVVEEVTLQLDKDAKAGKSSTRKSFSSFFSKKTKGGKTKKRHITPLH